MFQRVKYFHYHLNDSKNPTSSVRLGKIQNFNLPPESAKRIAKMMYLTMPSTMMKTRKPAAAIDR